MTLLLILSVILTGIGAALAAPPLLIAVIVLPALWACWRLCQPTYEPDIQRGRLQLQQKEFDRFALIDPLPQVANDELVLDPNHSLRLHLITLRESMSLGIIAAQNVQNLMSDIHSSAAQTEVSSLHALFESARMGADGRGYYAVCHESLRLARRGKKLASSAQPILQRVIETNSELASALSRQLELEDQQASQAYQMAIEMRDRCLELQQDLSDIHAMPGADRKQLRTLTDLLAKTRNNIGSLIRCSDGVLQRATTQAG